MQTRTRIKICGFTRAEDIAAAVDAGVDALGFVFYAKSPRYVSPEQARELIASVPPFVSTVGLFVNASIAEVQAVCEVAPLSLLQFHGDESMAECVAIAAACKKPFLRAFRVKPDTTGADLLQCAFDYRHASPYFAALLLDTFVDAYGGAGKVFDWSLIPKELAPLVVLSGGLNVQNVAGALAQIRPYALDISSGVESAKGIKDAAKMREFIAIARQADMNPPQAPQ